MTCRVCETAIAGRARFCPECGTRVSVDPPPFDRLPSDRLSPEQPLPASRTYVSPLLPTLPSHVLAHRQPLGILWCVEGGLHLVGCGVLAAIFLMPAHQGSGPPWLSAAALIFLIPALLGAIGILALIVGYGLLTQRPWGRSLALVAGILSLPNLPLGTLLGAYTLWVLGPQASNLEWTQLND